jgi:putative CocE/NonD family hydrolase
MDEKWNRFDHGTPDGYQFFLDMGPLKNANENHLHGEIAFWNDVIAHPNYDEFWQARNILPHLRNVAPAVLTVGGWFDAEDLYGSLNIYRAIEQQNPGINNMLVMGPWIHGGWGRTDGDRLGNARFGDKTSLFYRPNIELAFFNYYLHDRGEMDLPEAYIFETGANRWRTFDAWPPKEIESRELDLQCDGTLTLNNTQSPNHHLAKSPDDFSEFISDPAKPVPFTEAIEVGMTKEYMTDDQRFAARRPDVLVWQSDVLEDDITLAGPIIADLWVSTSAGDADWIVKVIDVVPNDAPSPDDLPPGRRMGGYQMMVRSEVIRGRFRNSYSHPEPFVPNEPARIVLPLQDVLHTFQKGHRVMVQVQSTWFPLVDRNPQKYVENIFEAEEADFIKATHRVYCSDELPSKLRVGVLPRSEDHEPEE